MVDIAVNDGGHSPDLASLQMETIGARVVGLRKSKNLSQEKLGKAIGVSKQTISSWEKELVKNIELEHLFALSDALDVDARWMALGHHNRLCAPIQGFPVSETGKFRLRSNRARSSGSE